MSPKWQHLPCRTGRFAERFPDPHGSSLRLKTLFFCTRCLSAHSSHPPPLPCACSEGPGEHRPEVHVGARTQPSILPRSSLSAPPLQLPERIPTNCLPGGAGRAPSTFPVRALPGEKPTRGGPAVPLGRDDRWQLREPPQQRRRDGGGDSGGASSPGLEPVKPRAPPASRLPLGRRSRDSGARAPGSSGGHACS